MTIPLAIDPVAFAIGPIEVRWYGLFTVAAIVVAVSLARRAARTAGIDATIVDDGALWVGVAALIGGRVLYVLQNELPSVAAHPLALIAVWHGGLSFYGGLIAGLIVLALFARHRGIPVAIAADVAAPGAAVGQAIGHVGCLIGGDSFGLPTSGPLAVVYTDPGAMAPLGVPLHPTQLYEAVALVILGFVLWRARTSMARLGPGSLAATYLIGNAVIRFALFFLRDDIALVGGLKVAQVVALGIAVGGIAWLASVLRARPREAFGV